MIIEEGFSFDDLLLVPKHSNVTSRSNVDISVELKCGKFYHPIIPANMKTITGEEMALEVSGSGGLAILHRFMPLEDQIKIAQKFNAEMNRGDLGVSIGVKDDDKEAVDAFYSVGTRIFCIDIAHGDSLACMNMIKWIKKSYSDCYVIAGNTATGSAAVNLWSAGADMVKVGVGAGSICTTRIETGNGVPQISALLDTFKARDKEYGSEARKYPFIADGGIKSVGDIVKALCFADMVMVGNMFAGCVETPGAVLNIGGRKVKEYVGSSTHKTTHVEGVAALVEPKGYFKDILLKITDGLTSGCSYQGVDNLRDLKNNPVFMKITSAGMRESLPHDVILK